MAQFIDEIPARQMIEKWRASVQTAQRKGETSVRRRSGGRHRARSGRSTISTATANLSNSLSMNRRAIFTLFMR
jgi:hypothetical protein